MEDVSKILLQYFSLAATVIIAIVVHNRTRKDKADTKIDQKDEKLEAKEEALHAMQLNQVWKEIEAMKGTIKEQDSKLVDLHKDFRNLSEKLVDNINKLTVTVGALQENQKLTSQLLNTLLETNNKILERVANAPHPEAT